ncbi:MAG: hypothetical protein LC774_10465 [Acidobacteria bacterium]|nr:hypothetical protein [Acidobacteriota bacterium]
MIESTGASSAIPAEHKSRLTVRRCVARTGAGGAKRRLSLVAPQDFPKLRLRSDSAPGASSALAPGVSRGTVT